MISRRTSPAVKSIEVARRRQLRLVRVLGAHARGELGPDLRLEELGVLHQLGGEDEVPRRPSRRPPFDRELVLEEREHLPAVRPGDLQRPWQVVEVGDPVVVPKTVIPSMVSNTGIDCTAALLCLARDSRQTSTRRSASRQAVAAACDTSAPGRTFDDRGCARMNPDVTRRGAWAQSRRAGAARLRGERVAEGMPTWSSRMRSWSWWLATRSPALVPVRPAGSVSPCWCSPTATPPIGWTSSPIGWICSVDSLFRAEPFDRLRRLVKRVPARPAGSARERRPARPIQRAGRRSHRAAAHRRRRGRPAAGRCPAAGRRHGAGAVRPRRLRRIRR